MCYLQRFIPLLRRTRLVRRSHSTREAAARVAERRNDRRWRRGDLTSEDKSSVSPPMINRVSGYRANDITGPVEAALLFEKYNARQRQEDAVEKER